MQDDRYYEVQPAYEDAPREGGSITISDEIGEEDNHVDIKDVWGSETKIFHIKTPTGATLEQLASNASGGVRWTIPKELKNLLRHVNKRTNRSNVSDKDLDGDLGKTLFLTANVIRDYSNCPKDLSVNIDDFVPTVFGDNGNSTWVIPAGNGQVNKVKQNILNPSNIFTRYMLEHDQKCSLKDLNNHINLNQDPNKQVAGMSSKGVGWKVLVDNLNDPESDYASAREGIIAQNRHIFENADSFYNQIALVPYSIASDIYDAIAAPLKAIEKSYVNMNKWGATIKPEDGLAWNSHVGLSIDSAAYGADSTGNEVETRLNTPFKAGLFLEVKLMFKN